MPKVRLEVMSWLVRSHRPDSSFIVLEEAVTEGETVQDLLKRVVARDHSLRETLFDPESGLNPGVTVVHNDLMLDLTGGLQARLRDGDRLTFFPAFAGGSNPLSLDGRG